MDKTLVRKEESARAVNRRCSVKMVFEKLRRIHRKIPEPESLFNEVSGLETCNFDSSKDVFTRILRKSIKLRVTHECFDELFVLVNNDITK